MAPGDALVEVLWVRPRQFRATAAESRWAAPRNVALILFPNQRIEFVDLGDAEKMDRAVTELLVAVRNTRQEPLVPAQALYKKVMVPLLPKLGSVQRIFLSPDGSLNLVPFAALHDGKQYLVESPVQIHYLGSGRDLLREVTQRSEQSALVLADPDTGAQLPNVRKTESRAPDPDPRGLYDGLAGLASLPGARMEGTMIGGLLHVSPLLGLAATEAALRETRSPFILHIATHGLFSSTATQDSRGVRSKMVGVLPSDRFQDFAGTTGSRSLSTSALVLAGANHAKTASDPKNDGLLTAEEARSLHLFGTQLVVLSACDTGRGSVQAGQGVYGLRRSFLAAGAEAVVMSLWPVSDSGTQTPMKQYYQRLLNPQDPRPRITALREAMLEMKKDHPHPYYWAPFIAIGRDEPLRTLGPIQRLSASTP